MSKKTDPNRNTRGNGVAYHPKKKTGIVVITERNGRRSPHFIATTDPDAAIEQARNRACPHAPKTVGIISVRDQADYLKSDKAAKKKPD